MLNINSNITSHLSTFVLCSTRIAHGSQFTFPPIFFGILRSGAYALVPLRSKVESVEDELYLRNRYTTHIAYLKWVQNHWGGGIKCLPSWSKGRNILFLFILYWVLYEVLCAVYFYIVDTLKAQDSELFIFFRLVCIPLTLSLYFAAM